MDGSKEWLNEFGERHRVGGPAVIRADGTKCWYQNGKYHRVGGPAITYANGSKYWFQNGKIISER